MKTFKVRGPSYRMCQNPKLIPQSIRKKAQNALDNELDPVNLYNISWYDENGQIRAVNLPKELTRVSANIIVLIGRDFPSGSHKVGPAYFTLIENEIEGKLKKEMSIVGPSTGNFGIGTAYVGKLKGYQAIVVMPDRMSKERYERIKKYGGILDLTPGSESDVGRVLDRVQNYYLKNPGKYLVLAQFELMPNYRFHRFITGSAAIMGAKTYGNGKITAFVSAPGSAGTIAAGDEVKKKYKDAKIVAVEPIQCSTLYNIGLGSHKIEGIGDQMVTLIHNIGNTDYIVTVHDEDCIEGLRIVEQYENKNIESLRQLFGISGICNILASIKIAKHLKLGKNDNIVTIATDGIDRYHSVINKLSKTTQKELKRKIDQVFHKAKGNVLELSKYHYERLFNQKYRDWINRGYTRDYLDKMKSREFWEEEYEKIADIDKRIEKIKEPLS